MVTWTPGAVSFRGSNADGRPSALGKAQHAADVAEESAQDTGAAGAGRAEELVRLVADLYGSGLERTLSILYELGRLDDEALAALAADDLVSSLLLVHDLHPYDVATRV